GATAAPSGVAQRQTPQPQPASAVADTDTINELELEVGDRDPTYLRTRVLFSYDNKRRTETSINRFRTKVLYAFDTAQKFGASVLAPVIVTDTPLGSAGGFGDTEVQATANVYTTA